MKSLKSILEIVLMPIVIGIVGICGTYLITKKQIESTEKITKSDQQIKMLEIFNERIASPDEKNQILALRMLNTLDPDLSQKLAAAVYESDSIANKVRNVAGEYFDKNYYIVAGSFYTLDESKKFATELSMIKIPYHIHIYRNNRNVYAVCIGNPNSDGDATKILSAIKSFSQLTDSYVRVSTNWGEDLYKP